jgi:hypothetical protein
MARFSWQLQVPYDSQPTLIGTRTSDDAAAGILIPAEDTKKDLDDDPNRLPNHVLFKISAKTYNTETKVNYPFHHSCQNCPSPD